MDPDASVAPHGRRKRTAMLAGLLCAHCTLTGVLAAFGLLAASAPTLFGISFEWIAPPFFILGLFALWLWSGRGASVREGST